MLGQKGWPVRFSGGGVIVPIQNNRGNAGDAVGSALADGIVPAWARLFSIRATHESRPHPSMQKSLGHPNAFGPAFPAFRLSSPTQHSPSRGAATNNSPGRKPWVQYNRNTSPGRGERIPRGKSSHRELNGRSLDKPGTVTCFYARPVNDIRYHQPLHLPRCAITSRD
jgi:hypothetical protein